MQWPREDAVTLIVRPAQKEAVLQSYYLFVTISVTIDPYFNIEIWSSHVEKLFAIIAHFDRCVT
jgi:hypothetical protein